MKRSQFPSNPWPLATIALTAAQQAHAVESNWTYTSNVAANLSWSFATSWNTTPAFSNGIDDTANFTANIGGTRNITLNGDRTVGTMRIDDPSATFGAYNFNAGTPTTSGLIFEVSSGSALLSSVTPGNTANSTINVPIPLTPALRFIVCGRFQAMTFSRTLSRGTTRRSS